MTTLHVQTWIDFTDDPTLMASTGDDLIISWADTLSEAIEYASP